MTPVVDKARALNSARNSATVIRPGSMFREFETEERCYCAQSNGITFVLPYRRYISKVLYFRKHDNATVHSCEDRISSYEGTHYNRCTQYTTYTYSTHTATVHTYVYGSTFVLSYFRTSVLVLSYFRTSEIVDIVVLSYLRNMKLLRRYEGTLHFRYESTRTDGSNLSTRVFRK